MRAWLALALAALGLGGCATFDRGTLDDVPVVTEPPGATVTASTGTVCVSPCTVTGPRRESFVITVSKAGYAPQVVTSVAKSDDAAIAAASALKPTVDLAGRLVDVGDGAYYGHDPKAFVLKLVPTS